MGYAIDFFKALVPRMVKKNCRYCHERGFIGRDKVKGWILCPCVGRTIEQYNATSRAWKMKDARTRYKASLINILVDGNKPLSEREQAEEQLKKYFPGEIEQIKKTIEGSIVKKFGEHVGKKMVLQMKEGVYGR